MPETSNIIPFRGGKLQQQLQRNFRRRKPGQITALDIDGPTLRIAQAEARGENAIISRVLTAPLEISAEDRADPNLLGKAVRKALDGARVKPGAVVMGVPRAQVILRTLAGRHGLRMFPCSPLKLMKQPFRSSCAGSAWVRCLPPMLCKRDSARTP